jgi:hypothetical protein
VSGLSLAQNAWGRAVWILLAALALFRFGQDWDLVSRTGSIDFRNRVTGSRLFVAGEDAYHYKWLPGAPSAWCDVYANRAQPVTKTTVTPAMLLLTAPVAALPYPVAQRIWLLLEWACLAGVWWVWLRRIPAGPMRLLWSALLTGFSFTLAWSHHIDRGQYYILLTFLLCLWMSQSRSETQARSALTGALAGLLIALRPPLILLIAPFVWFRRPAQRQGAALGLAAACILPLLLNGESWGQYARAMGEWSHLYRHDENPVPGPLAYPALIEGLSLEQISRYAVLQYADSSLFRLLRACGLSPVPAPLILSGLLIALGFWMRANWRSEDAVRLTGIAAWSFLLDFFLPAYRNPYNDVLVLNVMACLLPGASIPLRPVLVMGCGLGLGWVLSAWAPPALWLIHLPTLVFTALALHAVVPSAAPDPTK